MVDKGPSVTGPFNHQFHRHHLSHGQDTYVDRCQRTGSTCNSIGVVQIANGLKNNTNQAQRNNIARVHNYIGNGTAHVLQNGISHLTNGIISNNKVAPAVQNYMLNTKDAISKMYVEVEGSQQNLHM